MVRKFETPDSDVDLTGDGAGFLACRKEARGPRCGMTIVVNRRKGITFSTLRVKMYLVDRGLGKS